MNTFTIYNLETGEIIYSTTTEANLEDIVLQDNEGIVEGNYQSNQHIVVDGKVVEIENDFWDLVRSERNLLLNESDWTQLKDVALTSDQVAAWAKHRQKLRDITQDFKDVTSFEDVVFPNQPV